ncbi:myosin heavy chain, cardiac muscle isoform-like [Papaver somniferum]|uniref:myosin heavy chain, cardiac muscle isoform-like n=1 Tax=Papaver somniferum TaxID=3469 RepID=UPI000E6F8C40|nr:myosin heavy chain, cardiac muscle isoform-like [Papaver somniferum]
MVKRLEDQIDNVIRRHARERSSLKLDVSARQCKIDSLEKDNAKLQEDVNVHRDRIVELRGLLDKANKAEDDREEFRQLKQKFVALDKERDNHMLSYPSGDVAITPAEERISALDTEKIQLEQNLAAVLFEIEAARKLGGELEKQLEAERVARRSLDEELNELVNQHEDELEDERADKNEKLLRVLANITIPPPVVEPEIEQEREAPDIEEQMDTDQGAPGDGQA